MIIPEMGPGCPEARDFSTRKIDMMAAKHNATCENGTIDLEAYSSIFFLYFFKFFFTELTNSDSLLKCFLLVCGGKSPFSGATGTLCFGLLLILPTGFKARVNATFPSFFYHLRIMILKVNSDGQTRECTCSLSHAERECYYIGGSRGIVSGASPLKGPDSFVSTYKIFET